MDGSQVIIAVAAFALVGFTVLLARSHAIAIPVATARICGYGVTGTLALIGVPMLLAIVPAVIGVGVAYVFVMRAPRADRDRPRS